MTIKYSDLDFAYEFSSMDSSSIEGVYLSKKTGKIFYDSDNIDEPLPEDIFESEEYVALPSKIELGLGNELVYTYVKVNIPEYYDQVLLYFKSKGAYQKYKTLLHRIGKLDHWYDYEEKIKQKELLLWCKENKIEVII